MKTLAIQEYHLFVSKLIIRPTIINKHDTTPFFFLKRNYTEK